MKPVFADTSYYIALLSEDDAYHEHAIRWAENQLGRIAVTEYVLVELGNALSRSKNRRRYGSFVDFLLADASTIFIRASTTLFRQGKELFVARADKAWSMVDCISFVVMQRRRITDALTSDAHFKQAGFRPLLRESPKS